MPRSTAAYHLIAPHQNRLVARIEMLYKEAPPKDIRFSSWLMTPARCTRLPDTSRP
jgi:hypothetical protein